MNDCEAFVYSLIAGIMVVNFLILPVWIALASRWLSSGRINLWPHQAVGAQVVIGKPSVRK